MKLEWIEPTAIGLDPLNLDDEEATPFKNRKVLNKMSKHIATEI